MDLGDRLKLRPKATIKASDFVSTGSTILNVAISNRYDGGIAKGMYVHFVGDSQSGKTWIALSIFAEAARNPSFDGYTFIYDDVERAAFMDMEHYFGQRAAKRIKAPYYAGTEEIFSETVEDFYDALERRLDNGERLIWVEDSMDTLTTDADIKKGNKQRKAREKAKTKELKAKEDGDGDSEAADVAGSYGMAKAKINSERLRTIIPKLEATGSILVIISQTRDKLQDTPSFRPSFIPKTEQEKKTYAGGKALKFYASVQIWSSVIKEIKEEHDDSGKKLPIGGLNKVTITKNKVTGRSRDVQIPIYYSYGIDDIGAGVDYLIEWGYWTVTRGFINATDLDLCLKQDALIQEIENLGLQPDLGMTVQKCFLKVEEDMALKRKPRYD